MNRCNRSLSSGEKRKEARGKRRISASECTVRVNPENEEAQEFRLSPFTGDEMLPIP